MFTIVIFSSFICTGVFPSSSPFMASSISSGFLKETISEALCGATGGSGTRVVGSTLSFQFYALHRGSFTLARTSSGTASLHMVILFALHAQKKLSITFPYSALMSVPPAFSIFSNSSTNCHKYTWKSSTLCIFMQEGLSSWR